MVGSGGGAIVLLSYSLSPISQARANLFLVVEFLSYSPSNSRALINCFLFLFLLECFGFRLGVALPVLLLLGMNGFDGVCAFGLFRRGANILSLALVFFLPRVASR